MVWGLAGTQDTWASSLVWVGRWLEPTDPQVRRDRGRAESKQALTLSSLKPQEQQCKKEEAAGKKDSKGCFLLCRLRAAWEGISRLE